MPSALFASLLASTIAVLLLLFTGMCVHKSHTCSHAQTHTHSYALAHAHETVVCRLLDCTRANAKVLGVGKLDQPAQIRHREHHYERVHWYAFLTFVYFCLFYVHTCMCCVCLNMLSCLLACAYASVRACVRVCV